MMMWIKTIGKKTKNLIGSEIKKREKMKKFITMMMVAVAMIACTEDPRGEITPNNPETPYTTLIAESAADISRTTLDGTDGVSIHWDAGDQIYVWPEGGTTGVAYKTTDGGHRRALFGAATQVKEGNIYGIYPYAEVPVYEYDNSGNITNTTYVDNIKSVVNSKVTFDLGNKVPGTTNTFGQYCEGDISEDGKFVYTSAKRVHYDVLYGSAYYDGYNTMKFKHAFSAIRLVIPKDGWYNANPTLSDGYLSAYSELISKNPTTARLELDYVQIDFPEGTNVCGEMTLDAVDGSCTATSNSLRIYTSGSNSQEDHIYWGFFYAPEGEVEFDMTVKGNIIINDSKTYPVTGYTRTRKATFQNGHLRTVNLSVKDFKIEPVAQNEEKTETVFVLNDALADLEADKYAFGTYDDNTSTRSDYAFADPCPSMTGWKFYTAELMNTNSTDGTGWAGESSKVKDYNRIALVREKDNSNRAAFCTPEIKLPEGVESAEVTINFNALYNSKDCLFARAYVYVGSFAGEVEGSSIVTAVDGASNRATAITRQTSILDAFDDIESIPAQTGNVTLTVKNGERIGFALNVTGGTSYVEDFGLHRMFIYNLEMTCKYTNTTAIPGYIF